MQQPQLDDRGDFEGIFRSPEYEKLRGRLVRLFARRGSASPDDLADETISRVLAKVAEIAPTYRGNPARYVYAVARNVYLESTRLAPTVSLLDGLAYEDGFSDPHYSEATLAALERCLGELPGGEGELMLEYHRHGPRARKARRALAERLGIAEGALRLRVHRIRQRLYECVSSRLEKEGNL